MTKTQYPKTIDGVTDKVIHLARVLDGVKAIGLSGSYSRQLQDSLSDVDICVYTQGNLPPAQARKDAYTSLGFAETIYFDIDFGQCRGDGFRFEGMRCDFAWMNVAEVRAFLQALADENKNSFDRAEWLPGGLATVKALYDPDGEIEKLQSEIPQYSDARARYRLSHAIHGAHKALYGLGWLDKAVFRRDYFSFLKYEYDLLEKLFYALFALNHTWFSDEKRLARRITSFRYVPAQAESRIRSIILHRDGNESLDYCLESIKQLFEDTVACVHQRYPGLELALDWGTGAM